jgi:short subunit dehydrogenase-like uncharacterized protein
MASAKREFDLIVWGATGFTGRLVTEYLAREYGSRPGLRWAVGARNSGKLDRVCREIAATVPGFDPASLARVTADSGDLPSLEALAARTRVVISAVGPYALYGSKLVRACAAKGTDYCDLAGEVQWIREMIDACSEEARKSGARIVHCCGFDSVPFDLGVWFVQQEMRERHGVYCREVNGFVREFKGGLSGGTLASMMNLMEEAGRDPALRRRLADPDLLAPESSRGARGPRTPGGVGWDGDARSWTAPFVMSAINTRIVRRTNALLGSPWGRDFRYQEAVATGAGITGFSRASLMFLGLATFTVSAAIGPLRGVMRKMLPKPGEGPSEAARRRGHYEIEFVGKHPDEPSQDVRVRVRGDMDPGYGSTSKMIAECALCLALDRPATAGGSWTPASAMGDALLERLRAHAGLSFEVL